MNAVTVWDTAKIHIREKRLESISCLLLFPFPIHCEINQLVLTNESKETKTFTLFSYLEFCLWNAMDDMTNFQRNLNIGEVEVHRIRRSITKQSTANAVIITQFIL